MNWKDIDPKSLDSLKHIPGGRALADRLVNAFIIDSSMNLLDLSPGDGIFASAIAREFNCEVTCLTDDKSVEDEIRKNAEKFGVSSKVKTITGTSLSIPVQAEVFHLVYCLSDAYPSSYTPEVIRELYRVLVSDGVIGLAGPASFKNDPPPYMKNALTDLRGVNIKTPAFSALMFAREGFHIIIAEYVPDAFDLLNEWLQWAPSEKSDPNALPDEFRRAIVEDGGRWLSLGLVVLRKPPKPPWAI
ncbi:MAG: class I SAM-dependent methyltransferase [bacterium]